MAKDSILQNTSERLAQLRAITPTYDEAKENITSGRSGRVLADYFIGLAEGAKDGFLAMVNPMTYKMIVDAVGKGLGEGTAFMMTDSMNKEQKWEVVKQNITIMVEVVTQLGDKFNNLPEDEKGKVVGEIAGIVWGGAKGAQLLGKASSIALKAANKAPVLGATIKAPSLPKMPEIKLSMPEGLSKAFANINENITTWAKANNVEALTNQIKELDAAYKAAQTSGQLGLQESSQYISQFNSLKRNLVAAKLIEGISASMKAALDWAILQTQAMSASLQNTVQNISQSAQNMGDKVAQGAKNMVNPNRSEVVQMANKIADSIVGNARSAQKALLEFTGKNMTGAEGKALVAQIENKIANVESTLKNLPNQNLAKRLNSTDEEAIQNLYQQLGSHVKTYPSSLLKGAYERMGDMLSGIADKGGAVGEWAKGVLTTEIKLPKMPEIKLSMPEGLSKAFANINENITTWAKANNVEALTNQIKELDAAYKAAQTSGQLGLQESSQYISQFNSLKRNLVAAKLIEGISASMKAALDWAIQKIDNMITSISETGGKVIKNMTDMSRSEILQGGAKLLGKIENSVQSARNSLITINGRNALIGSEGKELVQKISELNSFLKDPEVMKAIYSANRITKEALLQDIENLYTELGKVSITLPSLSNGFQQMRNMFQGLSQKGGELGAWADKVLVTTITAKDNALNAVAQSVGAKPLQMPNIIAPAFGEEIENKPISSRKAEILNTVKGDTLKNITITNYKQGDWKEINFSIAKSLGIPLNKNSEASLIAFGKQVQIAFGYPENTVNGKIGPKTLAAIRKFENLAK
ncbi:MAG: hypothetical protein WCJ84_05440 [Candidatus Peregrinibacteria bacterium]